MIGLQKFGSHAPLRLVSPLDNRGAQRGLSRVPKTLFPKVAQMVEVAREGVIDLETLRERTLAEISGL
jgi:hypothetical protein